MAFTMPSAREQRKLNPRSDPHAPWFHLDPIVAACAVVLSAISVFVVFSATRGRDFEDFDTSFRDKQLLFVAVGIGIMVVLAIIDYRLLHRWVWGFYAGAIGLLVLVRIPSIGSTDASGVVYSWFRFGSFSLQPSEPAKLAMVLALAWWISRGEGSLDISGLGVALLIAAGPMALIYLQPDVGTMLVYASITAGMLLVGGAAMQHLAVLAVAGLTAVYLFFIPELSDFQRRRLTAFLDPSIDANYNVEQSQIAIGNGGLSGTGFGKGTQTNSGLVPEQHTDFIFTVIGEELGFIGGIVTLGLFAVLILRVYRTAIIAGDQFGSLVCVGVLSMFVFQVFQSIGMTMGIMPVTGIPLPFISYGGSSAITSFAGVGLVISVHMRRYQAAIDVSR